MSWVLVVMVGTTVQTLQKVGWVAGDTDRRRSSSRTGRVCGSASTRPGKASAPRLARRSSSSAATSAPRPSGSSVVRVSPPRRCPWRALSPLSLPTCVSQPSSTWPSPSRRASPSSGSGWQRGQNQVPRPPTRVFAIVVRHRLHGSPSRRRRGTRPASIPMRRRERRSRAMPTPGDRCRARSAARTARVTRRPRRRTTRSRPTQRTYASAPERLVRVDVPEPGDDALIEEHRLQGRLPPSRAAPRASALRTPGRAAPDRSSPRGTAPDLHPPGRARFRTGGRRVGDARPVVELQDGALVRDRREAEASRHPQMNEQAAPALEPDEQVFSPPLDSNDGVPLELLADLEEVVRPSQPRIEDLHADDVRPSRRGASCDRMVSTSGSSGIRRRRRAGSRARAAARSPSASR